MPERTNHLSDPGMSLSDLLAEEQICLCNHHPFGPRRLLNVFSGTDGSLESLPLSFSYWGSLSALVWQEIGALFMHLFPLLADTFHQEYWTD